MRTTLLLIFTLFSLTAFSQNLIVNPGAESDPRGTGWTIVSSAPTACTGAPTNTSQAWTLIPNGSVNYPTAHGGTRVFFAGCSATVPAGPFETYQDIDLSSFATIIDAGGLATIFEGYIQTPVTGQADAGRFIVEFRSATSDVLGTSFTTPYQNFAAAGTAWVLYTDTRTAPVGTRSVRIRMQATINIGPAVNAYFDDLSFTVASTLPLSLTSFTGETNSQSNVLTWMTSQEMNTSHFIVERSTTGSWSEIGRVEASGNSSSDITYSFTDQSPAAVAQYRLKMVDIDGRFTYSNTIKLSRTSDGAFEMKVYPNPARDVLNVSISFAQELDMKIIGSNGQLIQQKKLAPQNNHSINISSLRSGVYILQLTDRQGRTVTERFSKR